MCLGLATSLASIFYVIFALWKIRTQTLAENADITLHPQPLLSGIILTFCDSPNISLLHTAEQVQQVKQSWPCPRLHTLWCVTTLQEVSKWWFESFPTKRRTSPVTHLLVAAAEHSTFPTQLHFEGEQQLLLNPTLGAQSDPVCPPGSQGRAWRGLDQWGQALNCTLPPQRAQQWSCCCKRGGHATNPHSFLVKYKQRSWGPQLEKAGCQFKFKLPSQVLTRKLQIWQLPTAQCCELAPEWNLVLSHQ